METISPSDIYDKDLNFLFGSGASFGLFPTLALKIKKDDGTSWTLEELATEFDNTKDERYAALFMHYYRSCIGPARDFVVESVTGDAVKETVIENYKKFIHTLLRILQRRKSMERRCNIFTTNYDGCFPLVADAILKEGNIDFLLNDGTRGFRNRWLQARNFSTYICESGIFGHHPSSIPQINLIHTHGSVYWKKEGASIKVDYDQALDQPLLEGLEDRLAAFSATLNDPEATLVNLRYPVFTQEEKDSFWGAYKKLPIVNPTKWKFHETVFEEHYYQMLRLLSYELEKPNAVLITFGFSFADEHILNLLKRSLSNPHLQVFICCFDEATLAAMKNEFQKFTNVQCIVMENGTMDFTAFNQHVFYLEKPAVIQQPVEENQGELG